jgi:hypothetical protein
MRGRVPVVGFTPANQVEEDLLAAVESGSTDRFLSTLLLARVLLPGGSDAGELLREPTAWGTRQIDGEGYVAVYTSPQRLADHGGDLADASWVRFTQLIKVWPGDGVSFAVNPQTPIGATMPGDQIVALAAWAAEVGLGQDEPDDPPAAVARPAPAKVRPVVMQKAVASSQIGYYLERGYDRVSGFVHRASEVENLVKPEQLYHALGLGYSGSPFKPSDTDVYVLRWTAHCPSLYRIPFGGQNEGAMRAMEGWVIERGPFRGNGFAPSEGREVIAEFKVDSVRLPHGAQLWRMTSDGLGTLVALFDADGPSWRKIGEE